MNTFLIFISVIIIAVVWLAIVVFLVSQEEKRRTVLERKRREIETALEEEIMKKLTRKRGSDKLRSKVADQAMRDLATGDYQNPEETLEQSAEEKPEESIEKNSGEA